MTFAIISLLLLFSQQTDDRAACNRIFAHSFERQLIGRPMDEVMTSVAEQLIGRPYEAGTLELAGRESLTINLRAFDCVTLIENVLALSRVIKSNTLTFDAFAREVLSIRYRDTLSNRYEQRLHYFTDWLHDNEQEGRLRNISRDLGGVPYEKPIRFMTSHRSLYPGLADDSAFSAMKTIEDSLNSRSIYFLPKDQLVTVEARINSGDIIAIATGIEGLDIVHTALAYRKPGGALHLLHAPNVGQTVSITKDPFLKYFKQFPKYTGIIVARPLDP